MCVCMCVCACVRVCVCMCVCVHACVYVCAYAYVTLACCLVQAQADAIQQAFDKAGGEGIVPPPFDPAVSDVDVDLSSAMVST